MRDDKEYDQITDLSAVSPAEVRRALARDVDKTLVTYVINHINARLNDIKFLRAECEKSRINVDVVADDTYYLEFAFRPSNYRLKDADAQEICNIMLNSGWQACEAVVVLDDPGAFKVKLKSRKSSIFG